jgi:hypothetical protein
MFFVPFIRPTQLMAFHPLFSRSWLVGSLVACVAASQALAGPIARPATPGPIAQAAQPERILSQSSALLSSAGVQRLMDESSSAISAQRYDVALVKLKDARQVSIQLLGFYQDMSRSFTGIDSRIATQLRQRAVSAGDMRDKASYQLALVHRAQNQPDLAVPLLVQIVTSQNPTTDLGKQAYQQLFELGFVETQYPRPKA